MRVESVLMLLALLVGTAGCASHDAIVDETKPVPAGGYLEINMVFEEGGRLEWAWNATEPLVFNIHAHSGGSATYLATHEGTDHSGSFSSATGGEYSLLWKNPGAGGAVLWYHLEGGFSIHSYSPG